MSSSKRVTNEYPKRRLLWHHWAILIAYFGIGVGATWPLVARLADHLPDGTDTLLHYWNGWWVRQALRNGQSPYYTPYLFYPDGISMIYNNFPWLHIVTWIALRPLAGGIAAYNLTFLLHLALCGFAAFLLTYEFTGDKRAAFLAGLIYQCWPYRMSRPSHPNLISTWWIPIFLLFIARIPRRGRWQDGLLAGLSLALVGYTRWQLLIPAVIIGGIYLASSLPGNLGRHQIQALLLAGVVTAMSLAPPALLLTAEWRKNPTDLIIESEETSMQTDLLAYLTPASSHPVLKTFTRPAYTRYYADRGSRAGFSPYIGVTVLLLMLFGVRFLPCRESLPWIATALVLILLALGPTLRVNGQLYPKVPMPYNLAARLFVMRLMREPDRFNMFLALPVVVLSAYGVVHVLYRTQHYGKQRPIAFLLIGGAILLEYLSIPFPLQSGQVSEFYSQLATERSDTEHFALLNVPVDPYKSKPYMLAQVTHHRPILLGHSSRYPQGAFRYLESQPWLHAMQQFDQFPPEQTDISRQLATLANDGIRYVVVNKHLIGDEHRAKWERYFAVTPRFEDETIAVYATVVLAGRDFVLRPEVVPGLGLIRTIVSATCLNPGQALEVDAVWGTTTPPGRDFNVELALVSGETAERQSQVFPIAREWPSREWSANAVSWGYYTLHVSPTLSPGTYAVALALVDPETGTIEGRSVIVEQVTVDSTPCTFDTSPNVVYVNALFGDAIRLLGYHLSEEGDHLTITLHWRSERRMDTNYKVFVHVFDPTTAIPVAQDDAMPMRWGYPTTLWGPGEVVTDAIPISLEDAPDGSYGIAVGIYDPTSITRLLAVDETGQLQPDGRLVLQGETVVIEER